MISLESRIENLSFGSKAVEKKKPEGSFSSLGLKIKVKPKKSTEKKKKASVKTNINLVNYTEDDLIVCLFIYYSKQTYT